MVVFSYNDVPFEAMTDAFAGFMGDPGQGGTAFEPKAVEQRFDLTGSVKVATPLLVDLDLGSVRWVDAAAIAGTGSQHSVGRYSRTLGRLTAAADQYFTAGRRVSLWEVACWHAASRAATVLVRHRDHTVVGYRRGGAETPHVRRPTGRARPARRQFDRTGRAAARLRGARQRGCGVGRGRAGVRPLPVRARRQHDQAGERGRPHWRARSLTLALAPSRSGPIHCGSA